MKSSDKGLALIKQCDGFSATACRDAVGVATIEYGHTAGVGPGDRVARAKRAMCCCVPIRLLPKTKFNALSGCRSASDSSMRWCHAGRGVLAGPVARSRPWRALFEGVGT
jgi:GH24 family phage-related lysozyme (muramidase)